MECLFAGTELNGGGIVFLRQNRALQKDRMHLSIVQSYRNEDGKPRQKVVKTLGYLDELEKECEDPIAHYTKMVEEMDRERLEAKSVTVTIDMNEQIGVNSTNRKNFGYAVFSKIHHELEIDRFLKNARRHENFRFNNDAIMRLLVFARILYPGSKRTTALRKGQFFERFDFTLDDIYNGLTHFDAISAGLLKHLHEQVAKKHGRETDLVYHDVTNYYFEIDRQDDLRRYGPSKEHRKDPIVQMGLLLDKKGLPITYKIFPGNRHDSQTLMPVLTEVKKSFDIHRIIVVADKGLNSGDNIVYNTVLGDGYIYSKSVRGASEEFKGWILDESDYRQVTDQYRIKSRIVPDAVVQITKEQTGNKKKRQKVTVEQKWIVFHSEKYAARAKCKREEAIAKAEKMIKSPARYRRSFDYGAAGYIRNLKIDKETGELMEVQEDLALDVQRIAEEEKYDGFSAIITSELDDSDEHIVDMYKGLWRIEDSFKVTKSTLESRPLFLQTKEHINAHFLTCFISLLIVRIVEMKLKGKYTVDRIVESLRRVSCSHVEQNIWLFDYADPVTEDIKDVFQLPIGKKVMTLKEIKNILGQTKSR